MEKQRLFSALGPSSSGVLHFKQPDREVLSVEEIAARVEAEFSETYKLKWLLVIFVIIFLSSTLVNVDHGALPGISNKIKEKLDIQNFRFGVLGSIVYVGLTLGSAVATGLYSKGSWIKPTLICSLLMNSVFLYLFTMTDNYYFTLFSKGGIGFFQIFVCIYPPVWADTFGTIKLKTVWLTFLLLAAPLGIVIGYSLTY
mmetsp:Transcript_29990/g.45856  ORF Transcript_29990/g.45856 Transcript_29990/m.45856 type:complete len:199 (+) Transcript_29990:390-986(+)|eukprot:CAMPEP_0170496788 /NCGR_PEP_ID=MMETSP0208-20121228/22703_1 /TAXON_ID=197538 /ORGANISM="Strombidium inclinatum, Strain S3" /LENGTH=198 /DNA_ID=CAMNT_0010773417 /DNA_START=343 /DNA_END=939 /DNA_ORIENTATION=-